MTIVYSVLHMLVDAVCATAMFGLFIPQKDGYFYILIYNFCAFALQMPLGAALDLLKERSSGRRSELPAPTAAAGILCTIAGIFTHPAVLGLGNALFHIGGGVGTIEEDAAGNCRGRKLGIFVAPGALGIFFGTLAAQRGMTKTALWIVCTIMLVLCMIMLYQQRQRNKQQKGDLQQDTSRPVVPALPVKGTLRLAVCCLLVVVLRSYIGMSVAFPWKTTLLSGICSVLAVAGGKAAGGLLAARYGYWKTAVVSLLLAAVCYLLSDVMPVGVGSLFLFNMTMPVTLYLLVRRFPRAPGFAFGFLTFALFLGLLPVYFELQPIWEGKIIGCVGSVISLLLLAAGIYKGGHRERIPDGNVCCFADADNRN